MQHIKHIPATIGNPTEFLDEFDLLFEARDSFEVPVFKVAKEESISDEPSASITGASLNKVDETLELSRNPSFIKSRTIVSSPTTKKIVVDPGVYFTQIPVVCLH